SGLKSSVINLIHNKQQRGEEINAANIAASFQARVVDVLTEKTYKAAEKYGVKQVIVAGGVAANKGLRQALQEKFKQTDVSLHFPPLSLCTDNAAMIEAVGFISYQDVLYSGMDLNANSSREHY